MKHERRCMEEGSVYSRIMNLAEQNGGITIKQVFAVIGGDYKKVERCVSRLALRGQLIGEKVTGIPGCRKVFRVNPESEVKRFSTSGQRQRDKPSHVFDVWKNNTSQP